jgi:hypothetical protein
MTYLGSYLSKLLETDDWLDAPALQEFLELPSPQLARSSRYGGETVLGTGDAPTALASPPRSASTDHPHPKLHPKLARPPPVLPTPSALLALLQECAAALEAAELANDGAPPAVGSSQGSSGFIRVRQSSSRVIVGAARVRQGSSGFVRIRQGSSGFVTSRARAIGRWQQPRATDEQHSLGEAAPPDRRQHAPGARDGR